MIVLHNLGLMSNLVLGILLKVLMWFAQFSPISSVIFSWFDMFPWFPVFNHQCCKNKTGKYNHSVP